MALTITVYEEEVFHVGDTSVKVSKVHSSSDFEVEVGGKAYEVNEDKWTCVGNGINFRSSFPRQAGSTRRVRLQVVAPGKFVKRPDYRREK